MFSENQDDWCEYVPFVTFAYNAAEQRSVGESPFFLMCHRDPKIPLDNLLSHEVSPYNETVQAQDVIAMNFQLAWKNAQDNLRLHQQHQKHRYDQIAKPSDITPGCPSGYPAKDNETRLI